jgi:hypothetical protein
MAQNVVVGGVPPLAPPPLAAGAAGAQNIQQVLIQHDRVRRSTDIPLFYGRKDKDTISPQQLVARLEKASRVAGWDGPANPDLRKMDEFYLSLRDDALSWYNTLDNIFNFNKENWNNLKTKFLEAYAPKYTAKMLCICFQDLRQKPDETVQRFYNRVTDTFRNARSHGYLQRQLAWFYAGSVQRDHATGCRQDAMADAQHSLPRRSP